MDSGSDRAGRIIAYLQRNKFLSSKEKAVLLKSIPNKNLIKRLLGLAFNGQIFRCNLEDFTEEKTYELKNADQRLVLFIRMNEAFFSDEIDGFTVQKSLKKLFRKVHVREFEFYNDLLSGGTSFIDYRTFKKVLARKDKDSYIRFMRPCDASTDYAWGGKQYIVQPNYQGTQMKLILEKGKSPLLVGRDQLNYEHKYKATMKKVSSWFEEQSLTKANFDCILCRKDKLDRPRGDWKPKDHILWVYDYVDKNLPLKKRLKKVESLCSYLKELGTKKIQRIPTEVVTGTLLSKIAKQYGMAHLPYVNRNGVIVKNWDSGYTYGRSADWLCLTNFADKISGVSKGRATLTGFSPNKLYAYGMTNNGIEIEIGIKEFMIDELAKYIGYTIEYSILDSYFKFSRTLYDNGREV